MCDFSIDLLPNLLLARSELQIVFVPSLIKIFPFLLLLTSLRLLLFADAV